jgi:hypothetical protein
MPDRRPLPDAARTLLARLESIAERDLLVESEAGAGRYRFEPSSPALAKSVEALAASYADRRVSVVAALDAEPGERIREFADAFRIRREDEDG